MIWSLTAFKFQYCGHCERPLRAAGGCKSPGNPTRHERWSVARNRTFAATRLGDQLDRSRRVFGDPVDGGLRKLDALIGRIDAYRSPAEIISDARMGEVRALAAKLIEQLRN